MLKLNLKIPSAIENRYQNDPDLLFKARAIFWFSVFISISFFYYFLLAYLLNFQNSLLVYMTFTPVVLSLFWVIYRFDIRFTGTFVVTAASTVLFALSLVEGGLYSSPIMWIPSVILVGSFIMASRKVAIGITAYILLQVFTIYILQENNLLPEPPPNHEYTGFYYMNGIIGASLLVYLFMNLIIYEKSNSYDSLAVEQKKLEVANKTKDRFFSVIAHDLRGPIGSIRGVMETLPEELAEFDTMSDRDKEELLELIHYTARQTKATHMLLENLLTWALCQQDMVVYDIQKHNLGELIPPITTVLNMQAKSKGVNLHYDTILNSMELRADLKTCQTAIRNLVSNAIKFSFRDSAVTISASQDKAHTKIRITDKGPGMDEEKVKKLFADHHISSTPGTENESGTGLGLKLVFEYIGGNHGKVEVDSSPGNGTTFTLALPRS